MTVSQRVKLTRHGGDLDDDGHDAVENLVTVETDTTLVAAPDGAGGVEFRAETGGSGFVTVIEGGQDTIKAHGSTGSTETFDPTDGNVHTATLNANCTFTINAPVGSGAATLELYLTQDGTGSRLVTWPGSVVWPGGVAPTLTTTAAATDRIVLETLDGGTTWYGVMVGSAAPLSYATPAIVLGSSAAAGAASTVIRSDSTIAAFDATVPVTQAFGDTAATGSAAKAARRDHVHGMPAAPTSGQHILLADGHATPFSFTDLLQMDDGSDFMWSDP
jgi:hypothetical protein